MMASFILGGNHSTWRKPPTSRQPMTNCINLHLTSYREDLVTDGNRTLNRLVRVGWFRVFNRTFNNISVIS